MLPLLGALAGLLAVVGVLVVVFGAQEVPDLPKPPRRRSQRATTGHGFWWRTFDAPTKVARRNRVLAVSGAVVGVVIWLLTGFLIAIVLLPAALVGLPMLLTDNSTPETIRKLEGLEEWTRTLSGVLAVGAGLEQAILLTLSRSTPDVIKDEVRLLVARLGARWRTKDALRAFADDLADPTADTVVAGLILASDQRGAGLSKMLTATAERAAEEVRNRRRVEADHAKPRTVARLVTLITVAAMAISPLLGGGSYIAPYGTPPGQLMLVVLLAAYVGCLIWMQQMSKVKAHPRVLVDTTDSVVADQSGDSVILKRKRS